MHNLGVISVNPSEYDTWIRNYSHVFHLTGLMNKHGKLLEHHQITAKFIRENENKQKKLFLMIAHSYNCRLSFIIIIIIDYD